MTEQEIEQHIDTCMAWIGSHMTIAQIKLHMKKQLMEENNLGEPTNPNWPLEQAKVPEGKKPVYKQCYSTAYAGCYCTGDCEEVDFYVHESVEIPDKKLYDTKEAYVLSVIEMDRWREERTGKPYSKSWQSRYKRLQQKDSECERTWHYKGLMTSGEPYYDADYWPDKTDMYAISLEQGLRAGFKLEIDKYG